MTKTLNKSFVSDGEKALGINQSKLLVKS